VAQHADRESPAPELDEPRIEGDRVERRVPMTRLRASIARRLVEAQHNAAMLTTFNEVDMLPVMTLRRRYQEEFQARHNGTRLGYMSFFVRTAVEALKRYPAVNASVDGTDIVYHGFYDIGVAVSTDRGLVVPVVRDADALSLAQIEDQIEAFGKRARSGKLTIDDMSGGTFTISNGGIFGSLLSTPILNPPQTGILGMHKIEQRPVVIDGEIVVRPMMYLALSYDHRLIDGREAVQFLVAIKELLEDPARILLEL
jgi:2-oxoglutarate dehydrogenase E2 component (dihydrolipoamide succinyltransferase)